MSPTTSPTTTRVEPRTLAVASVDRMVRTDLDLDFLMTQLRGTFEAKLDQLLALPHDDRACAPLAEALDGINAALARIHAGTYGTCRVCEGLIGAARLEVVPTAVTCVGCNGRNAPA